MKRETVAQTVIFACAIYLCKVGGDCGTSPTLVPVFISHPASKRIQETSVDRYFFISSLNWLAHYMIGNKTK